MFGPIPSDRHTRVDQQKDHSPQKTAPKTSVENTTAEASADKTHSAPSATPPPPSTTIPPHARPTTDPSPSTHTSESPPQHNTNIDDPSEENTHPHSSPNNKNQPYIAKSVSSDEEGSSTQDSSPELSRYPGLDLSPRGPRSCTEEDLKILKERLFGEEGQACNDQQDDGFTPVKK